MELSSFCDLVLSQSSQMAHREDGENDRQSCKFYAQEESLDTFSDSLAHIDPSYKHKLLKPSGTSIESTEWEQNIAKILVLYSGGTIGMRSHGGGK